MTEMFTQETFAELLDNTLLSNIMKPGSLVHATVVDIQNDFVILRAGLKSDAIVSKVEFLNASGELEVAIGDEVDVIIEMIEDGFGETRLSREKAKRAETWQELIKAHDENRSVIGVITGKVKGGFTVDIKNVKAFLPGSLIDVPPVRDTSYLEGRDLEFKVIKVDEKRNNIVVSRRSVVENENSAERAQLLSTLEEGMEVKGIIKNLTDYGAFVDLGGIDGLLHITDMSWKRVKHPSEVVTVGTEVAVRVLKYDKERARVSLGLKQMGSDPWTEIVEKYPVGTRLHGKVSNIADYGCFIEIEQGVEGLVHVSEMDWTNKNIHPSKVVHLGDDVEVMVLEIDEDRRRISLGLKQCSANPWATFAETHKKGEHVRGPVKSITDFGVFIGLDGNIDGLIHLSDLSWQENGEEVVRQYKKGQEVEAIILGVDPERERISLGVKQLSDDPFNTYVTTNSKGAIVKGTISEVDAKQATVQLAEEVFATLRAGDVARERVEDVTKVLSVGDEIEAKITNVDRKNHTITVSIKAKETQEEAAALKALKTQANESSTTTIGDLLKQSMSDAAAKE